MTARHRMPRPEPDGSFAGVVLAAANVLGLGCVATYGIDNAAATAIVAPDRPAVEETSHGHPTIAQDTSRPVVPPELREREDHQAATTRAAHTLSSRSVTTSPGRDEMSSSPPPQAPG